MVEPKMFIYWMGLILCLVDVFLILSMKKREERHYLFASWFLLLSSVPIINFVVGCFGLMVIVCRRLLK